MGQSKKMSLVETILNTVIGYIIALGTQMLVFPMFGIHVSHSDNILMSIIFTVVSIVRSYSLRRIFNWVHRKDR